MNHAHTFAARLMILSMFLTVDAWANMVGSQSQNFNAAPSTRDYVTVHSARTLGLGVTSFVGVLHTGVNTLPYYGGDVEASRTSINDTVTTADLGVSYGVMTKLDISLVAPFILFQSVGERDQRHGQIAQPGLSGSRLAAKLNLSDGGPVQFATVLSTHLNLAKNNPYDGNQLLQSINGELVATTDLWFAEVSGNIGYRIVQSKDVGSYQEDVSAFDDQLIASAAVAAPMMNDQTKLVSEVFLSAPRSKEFDTSKRHSTRAEMLFALRQQRSELLSLQGGLGSELRHGTSTADWRLFFGIQYELGSRRTAVEVAPASEEIPELSPSFVESEIERQPDEVIVVEDVLFKFNSSVIADKRESQRKLRGLVAALRKQGGYEKLIIEGHTCSIGKQKTNLNLSQRRAAKMRSILVSEYGFKASTIRSRGLGERVPVASNANEYGRKQNRRVEFKIFRKADQVAETSNRLR